MCDKSKLLCNFAQIFKEIVMRKRFIHILWAVFGTGILMVILAFVAIWFGMIGYMPDIEDLQNPINRFATQVYSADGKVLGTWNLNKENRIVIPYKKMSPYLIKALVATEDERFYEHSGIDFRALGRAIVKRGILGQTNAGGGSTITQQLAKQLYSEKAGSTMERLLQKPIEWVIAVKLERYYTKEEILALYLNYFDFLHNAVGIKTAANTYFNKEPKNLTLCESATLIGLCKNPSLFNPVRYPERARERRNVVLSQMVKAGYLSRGEYSQCAAEPLTLNFHRTDHKDGSATYLREFLRQYMMAKRPERSDYPSWNRAQFVVDSIQWENDPQPDAMDFLDAIKLNLYASEIFVFTPKGEIKTMPAGCTALDFAFQIHTFLGSHCIGAKVNHKLVPLSHKLQSGDQVEILTSKSQHVQEEWVNFVSSAKAKSKILAILRRDSREVQKKGENILTEWLKKNSIEMSASVVDRLCDFHNIQKPETLFQSLGDHQIILGDKDFDELQGKPKKQQASSWRNYIPFLGKSKEKAPEKGIVKPQELFVVGKDFNKKKPLILTEENINQFIFPSCCHAIPGDDVMGFIDNKNRIEIHKRSCSIAAKLKSSFGNRIVDAKWDMHKQILFDATIEIKGIDRKGMLLDVSKVISDQLGINIHKITISSDNGIFDGTIELRVHDREEVKTIMNQLRNIDDLQEVQRIL